MYWRTRDLKKVVVDETTLIFFSITWTADAAISKDVLLRLFSSSSFRDGSCFFF
eukprot:12604.XXX_572259_572420_1 [CDS] Oithona nana genome sequencing.